MLTHVQQISFTIVVQHAECLVDYKLLFLQMKLRKDRDTDTIWNDTRNKLAFSQECFQGHWQWKWFDIVH